MTTLRISITKEVLEATKDCVGLLNYNCAVSYAVKQIWPKANTNYEFIWPFDWNDRSQRKIFHNVGDWVKRFDNATPAERAAMQPFSFEIEVPDEVIGKVNIDEIRDIIKNSKTLELV